MIHLCKASGVAVVYVDARLHILYAERPLVSYRRHLHVGKSGFKAQQLPRANCHIQRTLYLSYVIELCQVGANHYYAVHGISILLAQYIVIEIVIFKRAEE